MTVTRDGDSSFPSGLTLTFNTILADINANVNATVDGIASAADFYHANGTLEWGVGDNSTRTIKIKTQFVLFIQKPR